MYTSRISPKKSAFETTFVECMDIMDEWKFAQPLCTSSVSIGSRTIREVTPSSPTRSKSWTSFGETLLRQQDPGNKSSGHLDESPDMPPPSLPPKILSHPLSSSNSLVTRHEGRSDWHDSSLAPLSLPRANPSYEMAYFLRNSGPSNKLRIEKHAVRKMGGWSFIRKRGLGGKFSKQERTNSRSPTETILPKDVVQKVSKSGKRYLAILNESEFDDDPTSQAEYTEIQLHDSQVEGLDPNYCSFRPSSSSRLHNPSPALYVQRVDHALKTELLFQDELAEKPPESEPSGRCSLEPWPEVHFTSRHDGFSKEAFHANENLRKKFNDSSHTSSELKDPREALTSNPISSITTLPTISLMASKQVQKSELFAALPIPTRVKPPISALSARRHFSDPVPPYLKQIDPRRCSRNLSSSSPSREGVIHASRREALKTKKDENQTQRIGSSDSAQSFDSQNGAPILKDRSRLPCRIPVPGGLISAQRGKGDSRELAAAALIAQTSHRKRKETIRARKVRHWKNSKIAATITSSYCNAKSSASNSGSEKETPMKGAMTLSLGMTEPQLTGTEKQRPVLPRRSPNRPHPMERTAISNEFDTRNETYAADYIYTKAQQCDISPVMLVAEQIPLHRVGSSLQPVQRRGGGSNPNSCQSSGTVPRCIKVQEISQYDASGIVERPFARRPTNLSSTALNPKCDPKKTSENSQYGAVYPHPSLGPPKTSPKLWHKEVGAAASDQVNQTQSSTVSAGSSVIHTTAASQTQDEEDLKSPLPKDDEIQALRRQNKRMEATLEAILAVLRASSLAKPPTAIDTAKTPDKPRNIRTDRKENDHSGPYGEMASQEMSILEMYLRMRND